MSAATIQLQQSTIRQYTRQLRLPTVGGQFLKLAEEAVKQKHGHVAYLEALLGVEVEERERNAIARRIQGSERESERPPFSLGFRGFDRQG